MLFLWYVPSLPLPTFQHETGVRLKFKKAIGDLKKCKIHDSNNDPNPSGGGGGGGGGGGKERIMTPQMRVYFEEVRDKIELFRKKLLALEEKRES